MRTQGFVPEGPASTGRLEQGAEATSPLRLEAGTAYMVVGVCSERCSDLDLVLSLDGEEVESDTETDDVPMLAVEPARSGSYALAVSMAACSANPCDYGVRVFQRRGAVQNTVRQTPTSQPGSTQIRVGQTVRGALSTSDSRLESDDTHYDLYRFTGRKGQRVEITMTSADFDAYLAFGEMRGGELSVSQSDDDSAGDNNPRIRTALRSDGEYVIRANSLSEGETGSYTLAVRELPPLPAAPPPAAIRSGQTVRGTLAETDPQADDESHYDAFVYTGRAGERLTITMDSNAFDTYVVIGRVVNGEFEELESNDDAGEDGTNSQLVFTLPAAGTYLIRATSLSGGETGAYTLALR